jgi:STAS-like domain of unknown function (DUF4325)
VQVLHIFDVIPKRALVARATARQIGSEIETKLGTSGKAIELDFTGVEAVTPSFIDEILDVIQHIVDQSGLELEKILVTNPPTRLSSKFEAIGRGRNLHMAEGQDSMWVITPAVSEESPGTVQQHM